MLRKFISLILLITMLIHAGSQIVIVIDYLVNTDFITETFCINKEKPKMKCNGKCHLSKELKKDEEKKSKGTFEISDIILFCQCDSAVITTKELEFQIVKKEGFIYIKNLLKAKTLAVFHPPASFT
jgi:hypothetical protein